MTRIAFITDVHVDVHALRDALVQIERLGCELVICCGDVVDYGLFPAETIALLREPRITTVRGNHDRWAVGQGRPADPHATGEGQLRDATGFDLPGLAVRWLASLPPAWNATIDGVRVAVRHGSPRSDMDGIYPDVVTADDVEQWLRAAEADVLVVGHTHVAFELRTVAGGVVANPGALLRDSAHAPMPGAMLFDRDLGRFVPALPPGGGTFGILEVPSRRFTIHRAADGTAVEIPRKLLDTKDRHTAT